MSYEDEKLIIYRRLLEQSSAADEADKGSLGKDGIGTKMLHDAVQEYNKSLAELKKKYNKE